SIISISDGDAPYYLHPNITYINHSGFEVGIKAVELLFSQMEAQSKEAAHKQQTYYVPTRVFELDSVREIQH
ncbi:MAG: hypothetical protein ACOC2C_07200, partial [Cyclonatronaceae bacterium]